MKIRTGFVSNSSSSSFVLAWKEQPKDEQYIQNVLFNNEQIFSYYDNKVNTSDMAGILLRDINWNLEEVKKEFCELYKYEIQGYIDELTSSYRNSYVYKDDKLYPTYKIAEEKIDVILQSLSDYGYSYLEYKDKIQKIISRLHQNEAEYNNIIKLQHEIPDKNSRKYLESEKKRIDILHKGRYTSGEESFVQELVIILTNIWLDENKDKTIGMIEISDNTTIGSAMEHGEIFKNLSHIRFSNH